MKYAFCIKYMQIYYYIYWKILNSGKYIITFIENIKQCKYIITFTEKY